ncbi:MAG TPA: cardiolipin synthase [Syntrophomonadaceae bacterium]|nr:cardiolipin synthase [Syntrophomonadaceae bacterium]
MLRKPFLTRAIFFGIAIAAQLLILIGIIIRFNQYFALFYGISFLISIIAVLWIINANSNPDYKIAWIIPILLIPIFGGLFYLFFGGKKLSKRKKNKMISIANLTRKALTENSNIINEIRRYNETAANQSTYIQNSSFYPPHYNWISEYLPSGEVMFARLKEELFKAESFIFMEYFIIEEGVMWNGILDILKEKASRGIDVRIIYDDAGCMTTLPYGYDKKLAEAGIKCCVFDPMVPILNPRLNNRDHSKFTVIDGITAFTGGINLADEYINAVEKYGHWKDSAIMLKGEAVWNLTVMFLSMWGYLRGIEDNINLFRKCFPPDQKKVRDGYIQPFADSPLDDELVGETVYLNLINKARRYVYITTPYLIIDHEIVTALKSAAKGGVDVRIITPHHPDKWYVHEVTRSYYKTLTAGGVKIYEYTPGFIHSKTLVVDDEYGVVGTINMDYRSFYLHFECGVWLYQCTSIFDIKNDFLNTLKNCREITAADMEAIKWYRALICSILRAFAPLM